MKFKSRYNKLPWYEEVICWIIAILILPVTVPIMFMGLFFGVCLYFYDKWNDGLGQ